ncbi:IS4 family transposase [Pseudoalteromonas sp. SCSIO 43101]|uniref:IS4 family transposase n=1 Tax=Pseudoalteromonas sp. SCSIO 43101 TaxID=2822847 RepID=UPI00202B76F9|nr:IS4 family transposase [Pseudoalteromonas sp. SCSIO 43101]URQ89068.1 IS4 family transposase [Pseudoalteromonas sp. SCSIO 43101]URQ89298.1 IS4 family transposase [Pseudoalteromonas sp. SCSIO 43101]URQ89863.1 IS4 family transposase [Pseudoalteromonas sp. SCSIO 43101]
MLSHWLLDTETFVAPDSLSTFQQHIPLDWISQVLKQTDKASIRKRKLPAELVVWLVVAMGLFRDRPISDVVEKLDLTLTETLGDTVVPSAIPQARQRLSSEPLEALFNLCATHWTQQEDSSDTWNGLRLFSVDGTQFRTADTPALSEHFHYIKHSKTRHTEYPIVRMCALSSLRSRLIHHVAFGPSYQGEVSYAKGLSEYVSDNSLTIFDRCYLSAELLINWRLRHPASHWMVPIKGNTQYTIIETYSDYDFKVEMKVSAHARKLDPSLPEHWQARLVLYPEPMGPGKIRGLLCSLEDTKAFNTRDILDVYFERWEIENSYGEIKHQMLEDSILLRSQTVEGIKQELWGILLAYNLVRVEISRIAKEANVSPLRISFVMALRDIQDEILWCAIASPGSIPKKLKAMREKVKRYILPEKRKRPKSRTVRISKTRYTIQSKHA